MSFIPSNRRRPVIEVLEDRLNPVAVTVTNATDVVNAFPPLFGIAELQNNPGPDGISLREAIMAANKTAGHDTVTFASALSGQTIRLSLGSLLVGGSALTVQRLGVDRLTIPLKSAVR